MKRKTKRAKKLKTDGLGADDLRKIRNAVRQIWHRSHPRKLAVIRCTGKDGFARCEKCGKKTPVLKIDHVKAVGKVDGGFIDRMFCPSARLQGLCKKCHDAKTALENSLRRLGLGDDDAE